MKTINRYSKVGFEGIIIFLFIFFYFNANGATINLSSSTNWSAITSGTGPGGTPGSSDIINITAPANGNLTFTVNFGVGNTGISPTCSSINISGSGSGNKNATITFSGTGTLTVTGTLTLSANSGSNPGILTLTSTTTLIAGVLATGPGNTPTYNIGIGTIITTGTFSMPAGATTFGNLTINAGSTVSTSANISASGTIIVNGILNPGTGNTVGGSISGSGTINITASGNANDLTAQYTGSVNYTALTVKLSGSGTIQKLPAGSYYNLTINNANGITLTGSITINNILNFSSGIITIGANNMIISNGGSISGYNSTAYVLINSTGVLEMQANHIGGTVFPIGDGYNPITITPNTDAVFDVAVSNGVTDGDGLAILQHAVGETWAIKLVSGVQNVNINLQWNLSDELSLFDRYNSHVAFRNSIIGGQAAAKWVDLTTFGPANGTGPYTLAGPINSMSSAATYYIAIGDNISPLPVVLIAFDARYSDGQVNLNWTTASEQNNAYFSIERSLNGTEWNTIGRVEGKGTTNNISNYSFVDPLLETVLSGNIYYRLKQIDFNGKFEYSTIIALAATNANSLLIIYPNPVTGQDLYLKFPQSINRNTMISLCDINGRCIIEGNVYVSGEVYHLNNINWGTMKKGIYNLVVQDNDTIYRQVVIKE
jgi:hypothetical protein